MRFQNTPLHETGAVLFIATSIQRLHKDIISSDCSAQYDDNWATWVYHTRIYHTMHWDAYIIRDEFVTDSAYIHIHTHP